MTGTTDRQAPVTTVAKPIDGSRISDTVGISTLAMDNAGSACIRPSIYIDGKLVAYAIGASLSYGWNTRKEVPGTHSIQAVARDAAGKTAQQTIHVSK